jgi:hypothetical protein
MKKMIKYVTALVLAAMLILSFTSCAGANPKIMSEKVTEIIDRFVDRDVDGIYAMFYPGAVDKDEYYAMCDASFEYFPVTAGYTCKMEDWYATFGIISKNNPSQWEGRYKVEFDGLTYRIIVTWLTDSEASGFTRFRVLNEEDWNKSQTKSTLAD